MSTIPCELEFIAENDNVRIVPNFSSSRMILIGGEIGPFRAGLPIQVPIWLAINLRQRSKCRILIPDWMETSVLERIKEEELRIETFSKMPSEHYMVICKLIFETCSGEIPNADEIRTLMKDIWDIRTSKLRKSISAFLEAGSNWAEVTNLTQLEISSVRPFFPHAVEQLFRLQQNVNAAVRASTSGLSQSSQDNTQTQGSSSNMSMDVDSQNQNTDSQN